MKKIFLILHSSFIILNSAFAQPTIQWQKCFGGTSPDEAYCVEQTVDGGYIVAGYTDSNNGDVTGNHSSYMDYWVVKLNNSGTIQWQKCLGGTGEDKAYCVEQTADGGYIVAGYTSSYNGDVTGFHGSDDCWIVKLDSSANIQWQKSLGGSGQDRAYSVEQTADGGYIVAGWTSSNDGDVTGFHGNNFSDYWVVKLDSNGNLQWQKCLGGTSPDGAYSVEQTADGGYIVAGFTQSADGDITGFHGAVDYWIAKLDNSGNIQWQKCLGGASADWAYSVQQTADSGYIVAGGANSIDGDVTGNHNTFGQYPDYWIAKLDISGNLQWQKCLGGTKFDEAHAVEQTADGGYIVAGYTLSNNGDVTGHDTIGFYNDYWIIKLNGLGNLQWQKCLGGSDQDYAYSVEQTADGGYIVAGSTLSNNGDVTGNHAWNDYWIVKLSPEVGIKENSPTTSISLFPNPATTELRIQNAELKIKKVEIYDVLGQRVFNQQPTANSDELVINVSAFMSGIYFVVATDGKNIARQKFVKE